MLVHQGLLPVSHPKEGLSREQLPLPSSLHVTLLPHSDKCSGPSAGTEGHPHVPAARASQGSTIHTSDFSYRYLVPPGGWDTSVPWTAGQCTEGHRTGTRTVFGASSGQGMLLCGQGSALVPPGPSQSSSPTMGFLLYIAHSEGPSGPQSYS